MTKTKTENGQLKTEYTYNGLDMVKDIITKDIKTQKELHHAVYEYSFGAENKIQRTIKGDEENRIWNKLYRRRNKSYRKNTCRKL